MASLKTRAAQLTRPDFVGKPFLAVDPGRNTGLAVFGADGRAQAVFQGTLEEALRQARNLGLPVIVEKPKFRTSSVEKNPASLITLATFAGMFAGMAPAYYFVEPPSWKGSLDKGVVAKRAAKLLDPAERAMVKGALAGLGKIDDALDAIALGLWAIGRADFLRRGVIEVD